MSEQPAQPGSDLDNRISVAPLVCDDCGHELTDFCPCLCHLRWDDTYYTKIGAHDQG